MEENLPFDREEIAAVRLLQMKDGDEPFRISEWSVTVHYVSEERLNSLPEFEGW